MARITIAAWGSLGDVAPATALATAMERQGAKVRLFTNPHFVDAAAAWGKSAEVIGKSGSEVWEAELRELVMPIRDLERRTQVGLARLMEHDRCAIVEALADGAEDCEALLVSGLLGAFLPSVRTNARLGLWLGWPEDPERIRPHVGDAAIVTGCTAALVGDRWRDRIGAQGGTIGGYWRPVGLGSSPDPELKGYLKDSRPIVVTLGSAARYWTEEYVVELLAELEELGKPYLLLGELPDGAAQGLSAGRIVSGLVDHEAILPHASLVIHQGGCGIAHAAARAGTPSLVLPQWGDQATWAALLRERGLSAGTCTLRDGLKGQLARRVRAALQDDGLRERCREMGALMRNCPADADAFATAFLASLEGTHE